MLKNEERIIYLKGDVRTNLNDLNIQDEVGLICNFAAIHREPGHERNEYYETNLLGAENICNWANLKGCSRIIFTSSISPYGVSEILKDEDTLPIPDSPYGSSKLAAEKIHETWKVSNNSNKLIIIRPGVVYGPGEGGNVTRMINATMKRYFFFMGNKNTKKAGIYIKELCNIMLWESKRQNNLSFNYSLLNASMYPIPSIEDYFDAICHVAKIKRIKINLGYFTIFSISFFIKFFITPFGIGEQFDPVRIKKLVRSNLVQPKYLNKNGYEFEFDLIKSFEDWKNINQDDWQ